MFSKFCRVNHVNLGTRSVKKSLRKRVSVKNKDYLKAEDNFDDILTNEEEVEAISHIGNLRRKPSVVRYGSRGARTSHISNIIHNNITSFKRSLDFTGGPHCIISKYYYGDAEAGGLRRRGGRDKRVQHTETYLSNPLTVRPSAR